MKRDERGVAVVLEILIALVVIGGIVFAGYRVMQSRNQESDKTDKTSQSKDETQNAEWEKGSSAVAGKYADASVLQIDDATWRMYYASQPEGGVLDVYSATSNDGKTWTTESGTRKKSATFPEVIKLTDGRYRMYYQSASVIKSAISSDGLTFADEPGTRIDITNDEDLTFDNVAAPTVMLQEDGSYLMVYRGTINEKYDAGIPTPNQTTQLLMWATSSDGLTWIKKGIAVDSRNSTLAGQLDGPDLVLWSDNTIKIFATSYSGVYEFSFKNGQSSDGVLAYAADAKRDDKGFHGQPPGDPTLAKIADIWYMYFGLTDTVSGIHYATLAD